MNTRHTPDNAARFEKLVLRLMYAGWKMSCPEWKDKRGYLWERRSQKGTVARIRITFNIVVEKR